MKNDPLGDRMKKFYENRTKQYLPRRTYTMIRIDGKAFHSYTRGLKRPFDDGLMNDMDETAIYLCKNIQGAKLAYVQSDEISILLTDFESFATDAWFDGNIQKIVSVSASMAAAKFNQLRWIRFVNSKYNDTTEKVEWLWFMAAAKLKLGEFDARTFTIPSRTEVSNYFVWRQQDATRNSISSLAQSLYSPKDLMGCGSNKLQEMCHEKGTNWNDFDPKYKRGRLILKEVFDTESDWKTIDTVDNPLIDETGVFRSHWVMYEPPVFTEDKEFLTKIIPVL